MSSLLRNGNTQARTSPGRMWLGALVAVGLLSTVLCLAAAGTSAPAGTAALRTVSANAAVAPRVAAPAAKAAPMAAQPVAASSMTMATTKSVKIQSYAFSPATLTISVGDTVTWTNYDTAPHTVTVTSGPVKFSSGNLAKGQSFTYTFTKAGTYSYYCAVHPDMVAKVVVTGSSTSPTPTPSPTSTPTSTPPMPMPSGSSCGGVEAAADAFLQHFYSAHLETSLVQQVTDALSVDQYTKTHTTLVANMLKPLTGGAESALNVFLQHLYAAHLETSPTQQVSDALSLDQYVKTHTVLIENMIKPLIGGDTSSC